MLIITVKLLMTFKKQDKQKRPSKRFMVEKLSNKMVQDLLGVKIDLEHNLYKDVDNVDKHSFMCFRNESTKSFYIEHSIGRIFVKLLIFSVFFYNLLYIFLLL